MISFSNLTKHIKHIQTEQLPFVVFRKPNQTQVVLLEQNDKKIHYFHNDFHQNGFIMAPFQNKEKTILLKADKRTTAVFDTFPTTGIANRPDFPSYKESEKKHHTEIVAKTVNAIRQGNFEKVVISRKITINNPDTNLIKNFQHMLERYPTAFCYLFSHPKIGIWMAATPEVLMQVNNSHFTTMALAGTQPYEENKTTQWSQKEKDEQQIVTNVMVKSIHPIVTDLNVTQPKTVRAGGVIHLCTDIEANLKHPIDAFTILEKLHPTPAVCGFPKDEAQKFILENEGYDRSFYTGYCGVVDNTENLNLCLFVNLRCMQIEPSKVHIYVGGGIVKESDPEAEWEETQNKAKTMFSVL